MIALFLGWIGIASFKAEHEIIKEVHPAVTDIKERMEDVHGAMMAEEKPER